MPELTRIRRTTHFLSPVKPEQNPVCPSGHVYRISSTEAWGVENREIFYEVRLRVTSNGGDIHGRRAALSRFMLHTKSYPGDPRRFRIVGDLTVC